MKFTCNNCGFTAEVPNKMNACPMCASQNVSFREESEEKERTVKNTAQILEKKQEGPGKTKVEQKKAEGTATKIEKKPGKITLNDEFFDSKPDKEHEEIAKVIKELYPETAVKKGGGKGSFNFGLIGGIIGGIVVLAVILIFVFTGKDDVDTLKDESFVAAKTEKETVKKEVKQVVPTEEEDISEIEDEIEEEIAKEMERIKAEEEALAKKQQQLEKRTAAKRTAAKKAAAKRAPQPAPRPAPQPAQKTAPPVAKPAPSPSPAELYNTHLQAGHKAVSERRFNDALKEYNSAAKARPKEGAVYKFLGITYAHMQNQVQACVNYRRYVQLSPNAPDRAQVEALIEACP